MTIIADSGATKTIWAMGPERVLCAGFNPATAAAAGNAWLPPRPAGRVEAVRFYGAGCTPARVPAVREALERHFGCADVQVESDMVGAARGLLGPEPGVACILGTGSASCLWDGCRPAARTPSLGYILGDEGSGAHIGRTLLADALKGALPAATAARFLADNGLDEASAIEIVYRQPAPARSLAALTRWARANMALPGVETLVTGCLRAFLRRNVAPYGRPELPVHFTGGVAAHFEPELRRACRAEGFTVGRVVDGPIELLAARHEQHYI